MSVTETDLTYEFLSRANQVQPGFTRFAVTVTVTVLCLRFFIFSSSLSFKEWIVGAFFPPRGLDGECLGSVFLLLLLLLLLRAFVLTRADGGGAPGIAGLLVLLWNAHTCAT